MHRDYWPLLHPPPVFRAQNYIALFHILLFIFIFFLHTTQIYGNGISSHISGQIWKSRKGIFSSADDYCVECQKRSVIYEGALPVVHITLVDFMTPQDDL